MGDYIEASTGASGTVTDIQIFHTVLTTPDNRTVFAPNGAMSGAVVTNYSRKDTRRVDFTFSMEYGTDFKQAQDTIMEVIGRDSHILKDPAPFVEVGALADSSVNITVRVWVKTADYWDVNFDMNKNIYSTFNERSISFPCPQVTGSSGIKIKRSVYRSSLLLYRFPCQASRSRIRFFTLSVNSWFFRPQSGAIRSSLGDCETKRSSTKSGRRCST